MALTLGCEYKWYDWYRAHEKPSSILSLVHQRSTTVALVNIWETFFFLRHSLACTTHLTRIFLPFGVTCAQERFADRLLVPWVQNGSEEQKIVSNGSQVIINIFYAHHHDTKLWFTRCSKHFLTTVIVDNWNRDLVEDVRDAAAWFSSMILYQTKLTWCGDDYNKDETHHTQVFPSQWRCPQPPGTSHCCPWH